jgi:hypothetical protein
MFTRNTIMATLRCLSVFLFAYILPLPANSQTGDASLLVLTNINKLFPPVIERFNPGGPADEPATETVLPIVFFRKAKKVSAAYDGYAIEIASADKPLLQNDPIFKKFGNIVFDRREDGKYAYLIPVPFSTKKSSETFLDIVIKPKTPEAKLVEYKKGTYKN